MVLFIKWRYLLRGGSTERELSCSGTPCLHLIHTVPHSHLQSNKYSRICSHRAALQEQLRLGVLLKEPQWWHTGEESCFTFTTQTNRTSWGFKLTTSLTFNHHCPALTKASLRISHTFPLALHPPHPLFSATLLNDSTMFAKFQAVADQTPLVTENDAI